MSVIFEALRKVKQYEAVGPDTSADEAPPANVYTIRGLVLSPQGLLGIALLLVLVGVAAYYGASYLHSAVAPRRISVASAGKSAIPQGPESKQAVPPEHEGQADNAVPPPPQDINYERPKPGKLYLPPHKAESNASAREIAPEPVYLPPSPQAHAEAKDSPSRLAPAVLPETRIKDSQNEKLFAADTSPEIQSGPSKYPMAHSVVDAGQGGAGTVEKVKVTALEPKARKAEYSKPLSRPSSPVESRPAKEAIEIHKGQEKQVKESEDKTAMITHLVTKLQAAMMRNDEERVRELFDRLKDIKGKKDPFLLKAQAYWDMKKGDYEKAARLLDTVLAEAPNDCEAGFNMAVIEINEGHIDKARERLRALREMYPANVEVSDLLREING